MSELTSTYALSAEWQKRWNQAAILSKDGQTTWGELHADILQYGRVLSNTGLKSGDRCAIFAQPSVDYVRTLLALLSDGIVAVPLNTRQPTATIEKYLKAIKCSTLIIDKAITRKLYKTTSLISLDEINVLASAGQSLRSNITIPLDQPSTVLFTSGSSGEGKACLHTFGNHYFNALGSNENIILEASDSWLLSLPLFHVAGLGILFRCLISGATIAIPQNKISPAQAIQSIKPTHISLVAAQLQQLINDNSIIEQLRRMKAILLGGSAIPATLIRRAFDLGLPIFTSYGSTEMASQITTSLPCESLDHLLKSGRILPHRELKISSGGEILTRGKCLASGYIKGKVIEPLVENAEWFHSGDTGFVDADGYLHVTGRMDAMFISGGENIHPEEIEKEILKIEGVEHVVVTPIRDATFGQRPAAFLRMKSGHMLSELKLGQLEEVLPKYKIPVHVFPWPEKYTTTGIKIERRVFQKIADRLIQSILD